MMKHLLPLALVLSFVVSARGQIFLPSTKSDREMGAQAAREVEQQMGLLEAPALQDYVRMVGRRLATEARDDRFQFSFDLADQAEPNAFAAPGGYLFVTRGLLALVNSEDELADVLAHEIIHVTRRHTAKQERKSILPGLLTVPGRVVGGVVDEDLGRLLNAPVAAIGGVKIASHSRAHEREADERGLKLAAAAGYDPAALAKVLTRLENTVALLAPKTAEEKPSFFDTHPTTASRTRDIEKIVAGLKQASIAPVATNREDFLRRLDGLVIGDDPGHGVFEKQRFIHPDLKITLEFPPNWKLVNTPRAAVGMNKDGSALLLLGIAGKGEDPEPPARAFIDKLRVEYRIKPTRSERTRIGEWLAFIVSVTDKSNAELHFVWTTHKGRIYQLIGLAEGSKDIEKIRTSALTLREASSEELSGLKVRRLRLAEAQAGETIEGFSRRAENVWSVELTALVNDLPKQGTLKAGQLLKVAKSELYVAH